MNNHSSNKMEVEHFYGVIIYLSPSTDFVESHCFSNFKYNWDLLHVESQFQGHSFLLGLFEFFLK